MPLLATDPIDLLLDDDGDIVVVEDLRLSSGVAAVAQGIRIRIQSFRGEWFLDLDDGVPYWQDLLGAKFNELRARAAFRDAITSAPGVVQLLSLEVGFDGATRTLTVAWEVRTAFGDLSDRIEV
jgi:hypothetical protein